jgi:hypothetical protein
MMLLPFLRTHLLRVGVLLSCCGSVPILMAALGTATGFRRLRLSMTARFLLTVPASKSAERIHRISAEIEATVYVSA